MLLSIIIPTLNEEKFLPKLLKSIKKQNFSDYEIIVADAGSSDKTIKIAKNFNCKIVKGGLPAVGRNNGAKIAKGNNLLFLDSDNILPDYFFERLLKDFKARNLDVAFFPIYPSATKIDRALYKIYNFGAKVLEKVFPLGFNSVLIKKSLHQKIGGFDEEIKIAEDWDYIKRAAKIGKFGFIETEPVITSARRIKKEGRFKTYTIYSLTGLYMIFKGRLTSNIFKYKFYNEIKP